MSACVICSTVTSKYRCPNCFERYCSVACCKAHKESCNSNSKSDGSAQLLQAKEVKERDVIVENQLNKDDSDDKVSDEFLQKLEYSEELKAALCNPHLRAMMENLVNTDKPEEALSRAMHEPIFTEFADICLRVVDRNNPSIEPNGETGNV